MKRHLLLLVLLLPLWAQAQRIAFINPGKSDEAFWTTAGLAMQAAARSLGVQFEQRFAERDPERAVALAAEIAARPVAQRPDYVILVNEKTTLVRNAQQLQAAGIKSFAAFSGLLPQEHEPYAPRRGLPMLLGSLEPNAEDAGYLTARALIDAGRRQRLQGRDGRLHLLAIAGDRSTPVSIARNEGMRRAVAEARGVVLDQTLFGDWKRELAAQQMGQLLQRGAAPQLVWAGSDQMAFGAMSAAEGHGLEPGRQLLFSGINTSEEAMESVLSGRLSALAGGHFLCGAWALVMLHDYHRGHDFARSEGLELQRPMFMLFGRAQARAYLQRFDAQGIQALDFRPYSKAHNPQLQRYPFRLDGLLR
ncbi:ABC transporter substrate-binding protein [Inhella proteolytica]|uniref:ABC transporter substrate-binding protein n=1 Tax=Inhella proteolytica TaxID=2795029 RepID=A0A931J3N0_9BURK|nr:ABC transporter substrate-binding protein [Inhella proteolytica]MBH9578994.1 ABC transporter substrate-binding protein [Inhella proteolytica]